MHRSGTAEWQGENGMRAALIDSRIGRKEFLRLPWRIYAGDPCWVPPLRREERRKINRRNNPFFEYGSAELLGVYGPSGDLVARAMAIHNPRFQRYQDPTAGFFGMFETVNDLEVARLLLEAVRDRLRRKGCTSLLGPVTMTPNEEVGLLIEGCGTPPAILTNYAPQYYGDLLSRCGLSRAMDLLTYAAELGHSFPKKFFDVLEFVQRRGKIRIRTYDRARWRSEVELIRTLYNESFTDVWGFVPVTVAEAQEMGRMLRYSDDQLIAIVECDGRPAGCILAALDLNEILRGFNGRLSLVGALKILRIRQTDTGVRVMVLGVLPEFRSRGIEVILIDHVRRRMLLQGYRRAEFSFVLEDNVPMRRLLEGLGFAQTKLHRVFQGPIDPEPSGSPAGERRRPWKSS